MLIVDAPSPNFGPRKDGKKIKYLILHYTGSPDAFTALKLLQGEREGHHVSAHYLIDEVGTITRLVAEEMRAWHAGKSCWEGEEDINSCSIGIEIQNPGHEYGYVPFTAEQIEATINLCQGIIERHNILPQNVLAHSDIAPERKEDPGELFPWQLLAENGVGLWPEHGVETDDDIRTILTKYGYDPRADLKKTIAAFQRHFEPDVFNTPDKVGVASLNTVQLAASLLKQKLALRPKVA